MITPPPDSIFQLQATKTKANWVGSIVALDPGETTGACYMHRNASGVCALADMTQLATKFMPAAAQVVADYINMHKCDLVVMEDYRVYKWKTDSHAWADLHTAKLIGAIQYICYLHKIPFIMQSAQIGKGFCTDDRLKEWGFYSAGERHARDAVRHGSQWLLFGEVQK